MLDTTNEGCLIQGRHCQVCNMSVLPMNKEKEALLDKFRHSAEAEWLGGLKYLETTILMVTLSPSGR